MATATNAALAEIAKLTVGYDSPVAFTYVATGTGTAAESTTDTALGTEITDSGLARAAGTASVTTTAVTNDTAQIAKTYSVTGSKTVGEVGAFNDASAGDMLLRHKLGTAKDLVNGDSYTVTIQVQFARSA